MSDRFLYNCSSCNGLIDVARDEISEQHFCPHCEAVEKPEEASSQNFTYRCDSCSNLNEVAKEAMSGECRCSHCGFVEIPAPPRNMKTQKAVKSVGKTFMICFVVIFLIFGTMTGILPVLIAAAIVVAMIVIPAYLICTIGMHLLYGNSVAYQDYRKNGGHPFWDNFLTSGDKYYSLPHREPDYDEFVPPGSWKYQCYRCHARVQSATGNCWNCGTKFDPSIDRADRWLN